MQLKKITLYVADFNGTIDVESLQSRIDSEILNKEGNSGKCYAFLSDKKEVQRTRFMKDYESGIMDYYREDEWKEVMDGE